MSAPTKFGIGDMVFVVDAVTCENGLVRIGRRVRVLASNTVRMPHVPAVTRYLIGVDAVETWADEHCLGTAPVVVQ